MSAAVGTAEFVAVVSAAAFVLWVWDRRAHTAGRAPYEKTSDSDWVDRCWSDWPAGSGWSAGHRPEVGASAGRPAVTGKWQRGGPADIRRSVENGKQARALRALRGDNEA